MPPSPSDPSPQLALARRLNAENMTLSNRLWILASAFLPRHTLLAIAPHYGTAPLFYRCLTVVLPLFCWCFEGPTALGPRFGLAAPRYRVRFASS